MVGPKKLHLGVTSNCFMQNYRPFKMMSKLHKLMHDAMTKCDLLWGTIFGPPNRWGMLEAYFVIGYMS